MRRQVFPVFVTLAWNSLLGNTIPADGIVKENAMHVSRVTRVADRGLNRVTAEVGGIPLWFESSDAELASSAEAFSSSLLIPALDRGEILTMEDEVSPVWLSNVRSLLPILSRWWSYPAIPPELRSGPLWGRDPAPGTALCFSGGVDSFFTLLRSGLRIDLLVTVLGFDVPLNDVVRFRAIEASVKEVARETNVRPVFIRTNIREHPDVSAVSWERAHGGALAAIGHLLRDVAGQLLISSSYAYGYENPWGSHWMIDHLWSSDRLQVTHVGARHRREGKLRAIAGEALLNRHLRVCWENLEPTGNCSVCEKCVRTRLVLADCGELARYSVFRGGRSLIRDLDALPPLPREGETYRRLQESPNLSWRLRRAVRRLVARNSRAKASRLIEGSSQRVDSAVGRGR